ncbi:MAG: hypothetical protein ACHQQQ_07370 [Bacteroidota bacterium]
MTFSYAAVLTALLLLLPSCHHSDEPPVQPKATVQITAVDTGVVYARIRVLVTNTNTAYSLTLKRDSGSIFSSPQSLTDTIVLDTALLPKHTYNYKAYAIANGHAIDSSGQLTVTTMDTTSHNITWQMYTLGDGASSLLSDVAIINDTCVYAVGEIRVKDSTGNWINPPYNIARWDGKKWNLSTLKFKCRLLYPNSNCSDTTMSYAPATSIFATGLNNIWITAGTVHYFDGVKWYEDAGNGAGGAYKIWGNSPTNMYFVGYQGSIIHFDGYTYQKIQSGTTLDIQDIWGAQDNNGNWEILAAAGNFYVSRETKILSIRGTTVTALSDSGINWALNSVWFKPGKQYWAAGAGIWNKNYSLDSPFWIGGANIITNYTTNRVRGNNINDIFLCGSFGDVVHFNGVSWKSYDSQTYLPNGYYHSIDVSNNIIIAVGDNNPLAVISIGRRN